MATLKSLLILNQLSNNKAVLIPSITGEYLDSETNYGSRYYPNIQFRTSITWSINNNHIGDDQFYHYLPDLYSMIQYAAYGLIISSGDLYLDIKTFIRPIDYLITKFDIQCRTKEPLIFQCHIITPEKFLALNNHIID